MDFETIKNKIQRISASISKSLDELGKNGHSSFHQAFIQKQAIEIYELAEQFKADNQPKIQTPKSEEKVQPEIETPPVVNTVENIIPEPPPQSYIPKQEEIFTPETGPSKQEAEEISINEKISKTKLSGLNYIEKSKETPINSISKAVSISKKFEFINGLFKGQGDAYKACLNQLESFQSYEEASLFLENSIMSEFEWDENENLASEFFALLRRRFNT